MNLCCGRTKFNVLINVLGAKLVCSLSYDTMCRGMFSCFCINALYNHTYVMELKFGEVATRAT